ncbi:MAG: hypothetical protein NTX81_00255 [Candidatus Bathyarchaeota archaeon]|nr:hypothetical protein [Candidatus Bathyarchaeota archaeon]
MQSVKKGDRVSLNVAKRIYFFQTLGGISLNADDQVSTIIPETATEEHLKQIAVALNNEHLTIGQPERTAEMPDRKSDILAILLQGRNKITEWIANIKEDKKIPSKERVKAIETLVALETEGKNRKSVIVAAENALKFIGGISMVVETEKEKLEIKLTSGTDEQ